tara:strand:+ start:383 stop:871 length:489 start_codon:yes stop_codon:yes gene_type:complete
MSEKNKVIIEELDGEREDNLSEIHADQVLWKISQLENEIDDIIYKKQESSEFYDRKIDSIQKQISYRINLLETYMVSSMASGKKTVNTPNGSLRMTTRTFRTFGEDDELVKFSYKNNIPTRVTEKPDKKAILNYIVNNGDIPSGYSEKIETKFSYKTNKQNK